MSIRRRAPLLTVGAAGLALAGASVFASSHREAPLITELPKVDGTDFYMFRSYEPGREDFVTLIADYLPLQDPYGGPNYFTLDPDALYEIHVDNDGDAREDLTFQFRVRNSPRNIALDVGPEGETKSVAVPLVNVGAIGPDAGDNENLNVLEAYTLTLVRDGRRGQGEAVTNAAGGEDAATFRKPVDFIGRKSIPEYDAYARDHVYDVDIPGCEPGKVFVGQRKDPFVVNLGETFDLVNITNPLGSPSAERDDLADKNITAFVLEVPIACLTGGGGDVIAAWTTASLPRSRVLRREPAEESGAAREEGPFRQVSRLAHPLVNELVVGLKDKDRFNASEPVDDAQFADYVTNPTLPELLEILFPGTLTAPNLFPRADLVAVFLTGVEGLNRTAATAEMLRLNTAIAPADAGAQDRLGVIGGDRAGYPNGRRPGDDVVDIALRVVMGNLIAAGSFGFGEPGDAPSGNLALTDGAFVDAGMFDTRFPYVRTPLPGSPNDTP